MVIGKPTGPTPPGKAVCWCETKDGHCHPGYTFDSVNDALVGLQELMEESGGRRGFINYKAPDESYLTAVEMINYPRQKSVFAGLRAWFRNKFKNENVHRKVQRTFAWLDMP